MTRRIGEFINRENEIRAVVTSYIGKSFCVDFLLTFTLDERGVYSVFFTISLFINICAVFVNKMTAPSGIKSRFPFPTCPSELSTIRERLRLPERWAQGNSRRRNRKYKPLLRPNPLSKKPAGSKKTASAASLTGRRAAILTALSEPQCGAECSANNSAN